MSPSVRPHTNKGNHQLNGPDGEAENESITKEECIFMCVNFSLIEGDSYYKFLSGARVCK